MSMKHFLKPLVPFALALTAPLSGAITLDASQKARIDALFAAHDTSTTPGCALGIMSEGRMIYARGYGMATLAPAVPIDPTKLFDVASMSKQFTAASIVLLAQQGKLKLTDNVRKYVPELPDYGTPITLNHLLWHTSGLRDYVGLLLLAGYDYDEVTTEAQALDLIKRQRALDFTPGTQWEYSNTGYFLLGLVTKRVSGKSLNDFLRAQAFNPLFMRLAVFRDKHDMVIPNQALGYAPANANKFEITMSNWEQVGDGGLQVSVDELQKWDENFYTGQVGGRPFITEMYRTGSLPGGKSLIYARGLQVDHYRGLRRVRHGGDWVGYHADMERFPDQRTTIALTCNSDVIDQYALSIGVIDIALEKAFTRPKPVFPGPAPSLPLGLFTGTYFNSEKNEVYPVTVENGVLTLKYYYLPLTLTSIGPTTFTIDLLPGSKVEFNAQGGAPAASLSMTFYADEPDYAPSRAARFVPSAPADPAQFQGRYSSPELGVAWDLIVEDGALKVQKDPAHIVIPVDGPLLPATPDAVYGSAGYLRFTRGASGQVTGFRLSSIGMTDFQFDRTGSAAVTVQQADSPTTQPAPAASLKRLLRRNAR